MADGVVEPVVHPTRVRPLWVRLLLWWPVLMMVAGVVLIHEGKQRYEEFVSVDSSDVVMLQIPSPRLRVVCGSDYHPGGYPGLVADRCAALSAERAPTTRWLFWSGVALLVVGTALVVRKVGLRRAWPYLAVGVAVACWYLVFWLFHLPLDAGTCASVEGAGEMGYAAGSHCRGVVDRASAAMSGLFIAAVVLAITGVAAIVRRVLWVSRAPDVGRA